MRSCWIHINSAEAQLLMSNMVHVNWSSCFCLDRCWWRSLYSCDPFGCFLYKNRFFFPAVRLAALLFQYKGGGGVRKLCSFPQELVCVQTRRRDHRPDMRPALKRKEIEETNTCLPFLSSSFISLWVTPSPSDLQPFVLFDLHITMPPYFSSICLSFINSEKELLKSSSGSSF